MKNFEEVTEEAKADMLPHESLKQLPGKTGVKHILLFGGSRSDRSTVLVMAIIYQILRFAGSRYLICRYKAKNNRSSALRGVLMPWIDNTVEKSCYACLDHENITMFFNSPETRIGGLGDREQAEKKLGHKYNMIYFNEISQLSYTAIITAYSRLAMRDEGRRNLFYYDCNPGSPLHWAYKIFVPKRTFIIGEGLEKPELYQFMLHKQRSRRENLKLPDKLLAATT
jgi:phage terminase large subunit